MAHIKILVGDAGNLLGVDTVLGNILTGLGHSIVYETSTAIEDTTGIDGVLVTASTASTTINTKYRGSAIPTMTMNTGLYDDWELHNRNGLNSSSTRTVDTTNDTFFPNLPLAGNPYTLLTNAVNIGVAPLGGNGPGLQVSAEHSTLNDPFVFWYEAGATMLNSFIAPAKRLGMEIKLNAETTYTFTADGITLMEDIFSWVFDTQAVNLVPTISSVNANIADGDTLTISGDKFDPNSSGNPVTKISLTDNVNDSSATIQPYINHLNGVIAATAALPSGTTNGATLYTFVTNIDGYTNVNGYPSTANVAAVTASITSDVIKNYSGDIQANGTGYIVNIYSVTTGALVLRETGVATDGNGQLTITNALLTAATTYRVDIGDIAGLFGNKEYIAV